MSREQEKPILILIDFCNSMHYLLMVEKNYFSFRSKKSNEKTNEVSEELPGFVSDFFLAIETNSSALTRVNYSYDLRVFFYYLSAKKLFKPMKEITLADLESLQARDIERFLSFLSAYTIDGKHYVNGEKGKARKLSSIRSLFKYLFNRDMIATNITTKIPTPKIRQKEIVHLEVNEVADLLNFAENPIALSAREKSFNKLTRERDVAILSLFLGTGIRISECVGMNIGDVDLKNNSFIVTRKGGNQTILYYSDEIKQALLAWMERRKSIEPLIPNDPALFLSLQRKRITPRAIEKLVKKYSSVVTPLKKISPHKLRSTYGTNLYKETGDIYIVADVLGHRDVNTTKKHYAAISEDIRRNAAERVQLRAATPIIKKKI